MVRVGRRRGDTRAHSRASRQGTYGLFSARRVGAGVDRFRLVLVGVE